MTNTALLKTIYDLVRKKKRRAIKTYEIMDYAQKLERVSREEVWMMLRSLERKAYIDLIHAQDAGIIGVSITPLGESALEQG